MKTVKTINANGKLLTFEKPVVMGILNATPDSFFNQGRDSSLKELLLNAEDMIKKGAGILDLGGMTTKPGSNEVSVEEEWNRVESVLKEIRKEFPDIFVSIDTYRSTIAKKAADFGADIINDISAGEMDKNMIPTVGELKLPYIAMHMQGVPKSMQENPSYNHLIDDILAYFIHKIGECEENGIKDIIIDPGFGFGKTMDQNYQLLNNLHQLSISDHIILVGISRKSMIYKYLGTSVGESLNGTSLLNLIALQQGAKILRVHDVKEAMECIQIFVKTS